MSNSIHIPFAVFQKVKTYAELAHEDDAEIGGYVQMTELPDVGLMVKDFLLPTQEVSGGSMKVVPGGEWMKTLSTEDLKEIRGWWHSHGKMGTFHSGTDDTTLDDKFDGETAGSPPYAVSIVFSLPDEIKARLSYFKPIKTKIMEVPVEIIYEKCPHCGGDMETKLPKADFEKYCEEVKTRVFKEIYGYWQNDKLKRLGTKKKETTTNPRKGAAADTDQNSTQDSETDQNSSTTDSGVQSLRTFFQEDFEEAEWEIAEKIIDDITGMSMAELIENGQYDPELYEDIEEKYQAELKKAKVKAFIVKGRCPHQFLNDKFRPICHFHGKNFDCKNCKHLPKAPAFKRKMSVREACEQTTLAVQKEKDLSNPSSSKSMKKIVID
jgi:hypothetical protein